MEGLTSLGLNSASTKKEAAWRFLEVLLSKDFQEKIEIIPARQDVFEIFIDKEFYNKTVLSEEGKELLRYLVEHAHWEAGAYTDKIIDIIHEEVAPVWAGDRTAEQAADIIQNRVSVYMSE